MQVRGNTLNPLKPGDKIRIVSPAGKTTEGKVLPAASWLEKQGYKVQLGKNVFARNFHFAGSDEERHGDLQEAIDDPETKVIMCSRGGYGTVRIIDHLDFTKFQRHPKWIVGFSDITMLHSCVNRMNYPSVHGAMPALFFNKKKEPGENLQTLMNMLAGKDTTYSVPSNSINRKGRTSGTITGGNLSIITSLLGTKFDIDTKGKILFLEEVDEYKYHIDRMLIQLKLAGKFDGIKGLIAGDFSSIKDNAEPFGKSVEEMIAEKLNEFDFPVGYGFPGGHGNRNLALGFGMKSELLVTEDETIVKFNS